MKAKISFSRFSIILTVAVMLALFIGCIATVNDNRIFFLLVGIYVVLWLCSMLFAPLNVKVDSGNVVLQSILRSRKLQVDAIESVQLFQPTMGAIRIFGSGGFLGYWGVFREGDIGKYYAFYGKASDCFLIRMKNGKKYVVGCDKPDEMVNYINSLRSANVAPRNS